MKCPPGKKLHGGSGRFCPRPPEMQKRALEKEPLKIAIDCNVKACSMLLVADLVNWDVKSSP